MSNEDHPFKPGVTVALIAQSRFGGGFGITKAKVGKVYKTGKFVLEGDTEQWRATAPGYLNDDWTAYRTRRHHSLLRAEVWEPRHDDMVLAMRRQFDQLARLGRIRERAIDLRADGSQKTEDILTAIEKAFEENNG